AVRRCSCTDAARARRLGHQASEAALRGRDVEIDGFNVLTTLEAALGGAVVLRGRDGCDRDLVGVHGTYRKVVDTLPAIEVLGAVLASLAIAHARWLLDSPVSNSGRLRGLILQAAATRGWNWEVDLVPDPDPILRQSSAVVGSADSAILDACGLWFNL